MTMRDRFEAVYGGNRNSPYREMIESWGECGRQLWPPRPTDSQLSSAGVRLVGEEPRLIMPGECYPTHYHGPSWGVVEHGKSVPEYGYVFNETKSPVFVWEVEKG